jgi:hypothetical protein
LGAIELALRVLGLFFALWQSMNVVPAVDHIALAVVVVVACQDLLGQSTLAVLVMRRCRQVGLRMVVGESSLTLLALLRTASQDST